MRAETHPFGYAHTEHEREVTGARTIDRKIGGRLGVRMHVLVAVAYACIAIGYAWPLPLHLATTLPGPVSQDTGVYVWNLWVFRHEIVAHHHLPFATLEILSLAPPVPLALHNYTAVADLLAFPLIPLLGTVRTFNILIIGSGVLSAYTMFLFARRITRDTGGAWLAGLLFGFSPFMSARTSEHFSLVQTAPLVLFALLVDRLRIAPSAFTAAAMGATVALAYMCDPYYAVSCLLMAAVAVAYSAIVVQPADPARAPSRPTRTGINLVIACLALIVVWIATTGGGQFRLLGARIGMTQLSTPVLLLTLAVAIRVWASWRPRIRWTTPRALPPVRLIAVAGLACAALLAPVLIPVAAPTGERQWISPKIFWRSSAPGLDLLTLVIPKTYSQWFGRFFRAGWPASRTRPSRTSRPFRGPSWQRWGSRRVYPPIRATVLDTVHGILPCLALAPLVHIAGHNLYVPTPWAFLRYVPVIGAARMPPRMIAVVMFGVAVLLAFAARDLRTRVGRPRLLVGLVSGLLLVEMLPSPRTTYSAKVLTCSISSPRILALWRSSHFRLDCEME